MASTTNSKHIVAVEVKAGADKTFAREMRANSQSLNKLGVDAQRASTKVGAAFTSMVAKVKMARRELQRGVIGRAGGMARGALGMAGVFGIGAMIQQTRELEMRFSRFGATAGGSMKNMRTQMNAARKEVRAVSNELGLGQDQVLSYAEKIQEATGSTDLALGTMKQMGKVALATGADMTSLGGIVEQLNNQLGISKDQFFQTMDVFATQADKGSFELKNMAEDFSRVLNLSQFFNMQGIGGAGQMGALMQVAKRGSSSPKKAASSAEMLLRQLMSKEADIQKMFNFNMRDDAGKRKNIGAILPGLAARIVEIEGGSGMVNVSKGKKEKFARVGSVLPEMFGEGFRTLAKFIDTARRGGKAAGGMLNFTELSKLGGTGELLNTKVKFMEQTPAMKLNKALTKINNSVQSKMLPLLTKLSDKMTSFVPIVQLVMDNFLAMAKVFAAFKLSGFINGTFRGGAGAAAGGVAGRVALGGGGAQLIRNRTGGFTQYDSAIGPTGNVGAGRYARLKNSAFGRHSGSIGIGGALASSFAPRGAFGGGAFESGLDLAAQTAMMAGGPAGLIAGGGYFAAKMIVTAAKAEISATELVTGGFQGTIAQQGLIEAAGRRGVTAGTSEQAASRAEEVRAAIASGDPNRIAALREKITKEQGGKIGALAGESKVRAAAIAQGLANDRVIEAGAAGDFGILGGFDTGRMDKSEGISAAFPVIGENAKATRELTNAINALSLRGKDVDTPAARVVKSNGQ